MPAAGDLTVEQERVIEIALDRVAQQIREANRLRREREEAIRQQTNGNHQ